MKKVIVFDLDGTLAPSKSPLPDKIGELLAGLLKQFQICVISGGKFEQFKKQLLNNLHAEPKLLKNLHLMPTCGTRYYKFDLAKNDWQMVYAEDFTDSQKKKIITVLSETLEDLGYLEKKTYGEIIEDRGSQITLSTLGQDIVDQLGDEGVRLKEAWDPDNKKKNLIRDRAAPRLEEFEVRVGGLTSIDVTKPGIDKAYGMEKLMKTLGIEKSDILFIGDRLAEGGNDYPVKAMGIDSIEVSHWQDTGKILQAIIYLTQ
jgi:HAD superfamily hydrolase (TIGR01484 family)